MTVLRRESWYRFGIYNIRFASVACIEPFLSDDTFLFTIRRFVIYDWNYFLLGLKAPWAFGLLRFFLTLYPLSFMYSAIYVSDSFSQLRKNRNVYHRWRICYAFVDSVRDCRSASLVDVTAIYGYCRYFTDDSRTYRDK